jgi:ferric-dicitrate binding protein FerR (iron transport regulator)
VQAIMQGLVGAGDPPTVDPQAILRRVRARIDVNERQRGAGRRRFVPVRRYSGIGIAACAAALLVAVTAGHAGPTGRRVVRLGVHDTGTFTTGPEERLSIELDDGAEIDASPASRVHVGSVRGTREVGISGRVFVQNVGIAGHPVVVKAANAVVQNAGGRFTVRTDTDAREVRVAVAEGVIAIGDTGGGVSALRLLTGGSLGVVTGDGETREVHAPEPTSELLWEAGRHAFDPSRLRDALPNIRT